MTNITRKGLWIIVLSSLFVATFIFFCVATEGFLNWNGASWFEYWGKGKPKATVSEQTDQPTEQSAMVMQSANAGITVDSDDTTYTATKYVTPFTFIGSLPGIYIGGAYYDANSHGDIMRVELFVNHLGSNPSFPGRIEKVLVETFDYTYKSTDPHYMAESGCAHGSFYLSYDYLKTVITENSGLNNYVSISAVNIGQGDFLDSDKFKQSFVLSDLEYSYSDTTLTVPGYIDEASGALLRCEIVVSNCGLPYASLANAKDITVEANYAASPGSFHYAHIVQNSPAITCYGESYKVDLTKLSFASEANAVNTVYIHYDILSCTEPSFPLFNFPDFHFSISKLAAPTNVRSTEGYLLWDEVEGAQSYGIFVDDRFWTVDDTEFPVARAELPAGEHTFRIRALGNVGKQLTTAENGIMLSAFNASANITELVTLTYNIDGDTITKFVPKDSTFGGYTYEVKIKGKEFGGWYYDSGFSRPVVSNDKVTSDTVIYARLSDKKVTERQLSWWELHKWQVLIPCFVVAGLLVIAAVVVTVRKKKAAA